MRNAPLLIKSLLAGVALSGITSMAIFGAVALGASFLVAPLIIFGYPTAALLNALIPTPLFYQLFPEGGPSAFLGLSVVGALFQLSVIFAAGSYFLWFSRRAR